MGKILFKVSLLLFRAIAFYCPEQQNESAKRLKITAISNKHFDSSLLLRALDSKIGELFMLSVVIDSVRLASQQTYYPFHFNAVVITVYNCSMKGFSKWDHFSLGNRQ